MDEAQSPTPGDDVSLAAAGEAWSWRLSTPDGVSHGGPAPDPGAARRSTAFLAGVAAALERTRARWF